MTSLEISFDRLRAYCIIMFDKNPTFFHECTLETTLQVKKYESRKNPETSPNSPKNLLNSHFSLLFCILGTVTQNIRNGLQLLRVLKQPAHIRQIRSHPHCHRAYNAVDRDDTYIGSNANSTPAQHRIRIRLPKCRP